MPLTAVHTGGCHTSSLPDRVLLYVFAPILANRAFVNHVGLSRSRWLDQSGLARLGMAPVEAKGAARKTGTTKAGRVSKKQGDGKKGAAKDCEP